MADSRTYTEDTIRMMAAYVCAAAEPSRIFVYKANMLGITSAGCITYKGKMAISGAEASKKGEAPITKGDITAGILIAMEKDVSMAAAAVEAALKISTKRGVPTENNKADFIDAEA